MECIKQINKLQKDRILINRSTSTPCLSQKQETSCYLCKLFLLLFIWLFFFSKNTENKKQAKRQTKACKKKDEQKPSNLCLAVSDLYAVCGFENNLSFVQNYSTAIDDASWSMDVD